MRPGEHYDPAEKPPARSSHPPPLYHEANQRQESAASAPPLSADSFYQPPPQFHPSQYHQQHSGGDQLPSNYGHGPFRQQHAQPQLLQPQQSFQYYPPGQYPPPPQQQQQPLLPQYGNPSYGYTDAQASGCQKKVQYTIQCNPPTRRKRGSNKQQFLKDTLKLIAFHFLNALLGFAAFSLLLGGVSSSASMIPLCCLGIVVFRVVLYGVHVAAQFDVLLYNYISGPHDQVYLEKPEAVGIAGVVLAPSLAAFSPMSLMALLYFLSVKFGVAVLSSVSVSIAAAAPLAFVVSVFGRVDAQLQVGSTKFSYHSDPFAFVVTVVCLTIIGIALMQMSAKVSKKATKFFCCEPFSTYQPFVPAGYQHQHPYAVTTVSYGST